MALHTRKILDEVGSTGIGGSVSTRGKAGVLLEVSGTFTGTIKLQGTISAAWHDIEVTDLSEGNRGTEIASTGMYFASVSGISAVRANVTALSSGSITCWISATDNAGHAGGTLHMATPQAGGWAAFRSIDLDEAGEEVKGASGVLGGMIAMNMSASVRYLKIYDSAIAGVTVGTTTPDMTIPIATLGDTNGSGIAVDFGTQGLKFETAITIAATTDLESNGAPGANEVIVNAWYN